MPHPKTIRLWTLQSIQSIKELEEKEVLKAKWNRYSDKDYFKYAYKWMSKKMDEKGIYCNGFAPIWLWYDSTNNNHKPTLEIARNLLSDLELEGGIKTIEILYPIKEGIVFSDYSIWNDILDKFADHKLNTTISLSLEQQLFQSNIKNKTTPIQQATIPLLKKEWIVDIRPLHLKPNDFNYNPDEAI